tara:strand:- start:332 stop:508 length:177 start_codon:yes stop_codon:yes gene_type:complete
MQPSEMNTAKIYFRSVNDCTYYSKKLSGQVFMSENGNQTYECHCKLVPSINSDKVKVY